MHMMTSLRQHKDLVKRLLPGKRSEHVLRLETKNEMSRQKSFPNFLSRRLRLLEIFCFNRYSLKNIFNAAKA